MTVEIFAFKGIMFFFGWLAPVVLLYYTKHVPLSKEQINFFNKKKPEIVFLHRPAMKPNLRHHRADFKTNPVTENDAGPYHLAGTRCKLHCAVSSRTIWQIYHWLHFNEKLGKWITFYFAGQIFKLARKCCSLGMEREKLSGVMRAVEQQELATIDWK